jgi:hypothetical protein
MSNPFRLLHAICLREIHVACNRPPLKRTATLNPAGNRGSTLPRHHSGASGKIDPVDDRVAFVNPGAA